MKMRAPFLAAWQVIMPGVWYDTIMDTVNMDNTQLQRISICPLPWYGGERAHLWGPQLTRGQCFPQHWE